MRISLDLLADSFRHTYVAGMLLRGLVMISESSEYVFIGPGGAQISLDDF